MSRDLFDQDPAPPITEAYFVTGTVKPGWGVATLVQLGLERLGFWDQIAELVALLPVAEWTSAPSDPNKIKEALHGPVQS